MLFDKGTCHGPPSFRTVGLKQKAEEEMDPSSVRKMQFKGGKIKKACAFHLPPLVLYLYPDGLEFGDCRRRLLFCHWLKAVNLIKQKHKQKKTDTNLLLEFTLLNRRELHAHTHRACRQNKLTSRLFSDGQHYILPSKVGVASVTLSVVEAGCCPGGSSSTHLYHYNGHGKTGNGYMSEKAAVCITGHAKDSYFKP